MRQKVHPLQIQTLEAKLGNVCAICGKSADRKKLAVDHCHAKGHIRGLLCTTCNLGLGSFKDDPKLLAKAIEYLKGRPVIQARNIVWAQPEPVDRIAKRRAERAAWWAARQ